MKSRYGLRYLLLSLFVVVLYFVVGKLSLLLAQYSNSSSPVWFGTGIAVAVLFLAGYRFWPSIFIGAFLVNFFVTPSVPVSLGIALGNTLEGLAGACLINIFTKDKNPFDNSKTSLRFFFIALVVPIISATIGVGTLFAGGLLNTNSFLVGVTWWIGDVAGLLLLFPLITSLYYKSEYVEKNRNYVETILSVFILLVLILIIFLGWPIEISGNVRLSFLCFPIMIWIAFRQSQKMTAISIFLTSLIILAGKVWNNSIFINNPGASGIILTQLYIGTLLATTIMVSASVLEYKKRLARKR